MSTPSAEELIIRHMAFARNVAAKVAQDLPIDVEDAISEGYVALSQAANRFDLSKYDPALGDLDTNFTSFAYPRIKGAVIDKCRSDAFVKRRGLEKGLHFEMVSLDHRMQYEDGKDMIDTSVQIEALTNDPDLMIDFEYAMKTLTDRERHVVMALAVGAKGHELAAELGVTESRVSQIGAEARNKLLVAMTDAETETE